MKKHFLTKRFTVLLIVVISFFLSYGSVFADSLNSFIIDIQPPKKQSNSKLKYYDLVLEPNEKITLPIILTNTNSEEISLELSFHRGVNNMNGGIIYSDSSQGKSDSAPFEIEEYVELTEKKVSLKPNETKTIEAIVQMPDEEFLGVLAGGVYVKEVSSENFEGNIQHLFARELAILLRSNPTEVLPEVVIGDAYSQQVNGRNAIGLQIENISSTYIHNVEFTYSVEKDGKPLNLKESKTIKLAPNTLMDFFIPLNGEKFEPGEYQVKTRLTTDDQTWEGIPTFNIENTEAKKLNETDVSIEASSFPWRLIGMTTIVCLLLILVIHLINKNKKLQQALRENK